MLAVTWKPGVVTPPPGMRAKLSQGESAPLSDVGTFTLVRIEAPLDGDVVPRPTILFEPDPRLIETARRYTGANGLFFPDTIDDGSYS